MYSAAVGCSVLYMSVSPFVLKCASNISLLIFYLDSLSIADSVVLKSPTIIVLSVSPLRSISICLICFGAWVLGVYVFF